MGHSRPVYLPYAKREELFTFLDISIDSLKMHIEGLSLGDVIEKYVKKRFNNHFEKNNYLNNMHSLITEGFSFIAFGSYVIFDSIIYNKIGYHAPIKKLLDEVGLNVYTSVTEIRACARKVEEIKKQYWEENNQEDHYDYIHFRYTDFEILKFFADEEPYQVIFRTAQNEMVQHQDTKYKAIIEFKQKYFKDKLNEIYPLVVKESGFIINWYLLINEYVERLDELIEEDDDKNVEPLKSKVTMLLVRTLCNHLDIETRHESFYQLMSRITGKDYDAVVKYLTDAKMQCSDSAYAKNWINAIEILEHFKVREPQPTIGGQADEPQDNLVPIIHKLLKDLNNLKDLDNSVLIDKIDTLNRKYKNKN